MSSFYIFNGHPLYSRSPKCFKKIYIYKILQHSTIIYIAIKLKRKILKNSKLKSMKNVIGEVEKG